MIQLIPIDTIYYVTLGFQNSCHVLYLFQAMFEPYLKSFFVRTSDLTHIKILKLEVLTNLASESNISVILREFQTYISSQDKKFVAAAIQAIGRFVSAYILLSPNLFTH